MGTAKIESLERRRFLRGVPAAAAGLALTDAALLLARAAAQETGASAGFEVIRAEELRADMAAETARPGNKTLFAGPNFAVVLTTEKTASAKEFEWHEGRDHIFEILEGSTEYELGGTPQGAHSPKPGEWLAPECEGAKKVALKKGDILVIPRGTPHKRSTAGSVTFTLTSPMGIVKA